MLPLLIFTFVVAGCSLETLTRPAASDANPHASTNDPAVASDVGISQPTDSLPGENIIRPGDQIQITVWGYPEFNTTTTVKDYGTITVPLIGEVIAAGLNERQLSEQLKQRLSEYVKGQVRLTVSHIGMNNRVSVMGAVNKQGNFPVLSNLSLIEVIADAGGTTSRADLRNIKIYRGGIHSDVLAVDLTRYLRNGDVQLIPRVYPGDTIFIPEQENFIRSFAEYSSEIVLMFGFFTLIH